MIAINALKFWKSDGLVGLLLAMVFLLLTNSELIQSLERKAYDLGVRLIDRAPSEQIAVIAIDDESIANLGRWPWPREIHAKLLDKLAVAPPKVIGNTVMFFEPQVDEGLPYIHKIAELLGKNNPPILAISGVLASSSVVDASASSPVSAASAPVSALDSLLAEALDKLNHDQKLADSMLKSKTVLLPMVFKLGMTQGNQVTQLPDYIQKNNLAAMQGNLGQFLPYSATSVQLPIAALGQPAAAIGHINMIPDGDGGLRTEPLVLSYYDQFYPSLSLLIAAQSLNLSNKDIRVALGEGVELGRLKIATDTDLRMRPYFYADREGKPAFQVDSFFDVFSGKISVEKYRNKIVLIGATASGVGELHVTPISAGMPPLISLAHSVSSILQQDYFVVPVWATSAELAIFALISLYLIFVLPRLSAGVAALLTVVLLMTLLLSHFVLMSTQAIWLQLMLPATLLLLGHLLLTTKRFLLTEKGKIKSDADSAESNRMLGLAFQGQGQLDMAFDKFRKVPLDASLLEVLYNLGLDFERKRMFNKAESVFRYMADFNPDFRDLAQRLQQAKAMSETIILGGASGKSNASTLVLDRAGVSKPMLGRFEIEKELGKGAMGVVYLGTDPKIGRQVAIKTMNLAQEFEADELADVKARFFREAETAGRLNHPNIVTMYDAGEEQDLAFIAMEFLKGGDLLPYTKRDQLLPLPQLLSIMARVADALGYAHSLHVVHRDIKPANIMYDIQSDSVKVTDFGIARITDSSKTKTGMVLGTPSYMSPEQLLGTKIEGASDLFSLGVSLYQMLCGKLPFEGDSMAQLMYRIANEPPADILAISPNLPICVVELLNKALAKKVEARFQTGQEMADALRKCAKSLN
jgi:serine/threonine-protein kinase